MVFVMTAEQARERSMNSFIPLVEKLLLECNERIHKSCEKNGCYVYMPDNYNYEVEEEAIRILREKGYYVARHHGEWGDSVSIGWALKVKRKWLWFW